MLLPMRDPLTSKECPLMSRDTGTNTAKVTSQFNRQPRQVSLEKTPETESSAHTETRLRTIRQEKGTISCFKVLCKSSKEGSDLLRTKLLKANGTMKIDSEIRARLLGIFRVTWRPLKREFMTEEMKVSRSTIKSRVSKDK